MWTRFRVIKAPGWDDLFVVLALVGPLPPIIDMEPSRLNIAHHDSLQPVWEQSLSALVSLPHPLGSDIRAIEEVLIMLFSRRYTVRTWQTFP